MSDNDNTEKRETGPGEKAKSSEQKEEIKKEAPKEEAKTNSAPSNKEKELQEQLDKALVDNAEWRNKYYLAYADLDNLRKELEKDHRDAIKYRAEGFLENLLPALDSFYIALQSVPTSIEAKNYQIGFTYIYNQMTSVLAQEGVSEIIPKPNDKFDPSFMHAVDTVEGESEGLVSKTLAKGYKLKDRLVRPAMVVVTKKKEDKKPEPSDAKPLDDKKPEEAHKA